MSPTDHEQPEGQPDHRHIVLDEVHTLSPQWPSDTLKNLLRLGRLDKSLTTIDDHPGGSHEPHRP